MHRARALAVSQRTALVNQVRGLLGEFGIVANQGIAHARRLLAEIGAGGREQPVLARETLGELHDCLRGLDERIRAYDRKIAAWLGLTPKQNFSGGKARLGAMTKQDDVMLRTLLIHGSRSILQRLAGRTDPKSRWADALKSRACANVTAVALAAKNARIIWAMLVRGTDYQVAV